MAVSQNDIYFGPHFNLTPIDMKENLSIDFVFEGVKINSNCIVYNDEIITIEIMKPYPQISIVEFADRKDIPNLGDNEFTRSLIMGKIKDIFRCIDNVKRYYSLYSDVITSYNKQVDEEYENFGKTDFDDPEAGKEEMEKRLSKYYHQLYIEQFSQINIDPFTNNLMVPQNLLNQIIQSIENSKATKR